MVSPFLGARGDEEAVEGNGRGSGCTSGYASQSGERDECCSRYLFGALNLAETFDADMKLMYGILRTRRTENVWAVFLFLGVGGTLTADF